MKPQHQTFIREFIVHGDKHRAYKAAYPQSSGEALKTAARRLYNRPEIKQVIEQALSKARQQAVEDLEKETAEYFEQELATLKLKRQLLYKMMTGEFKVIRHIRLKDHIEQVTDDLSAFAILRAIELDTKLINNWFEKTKPVDATKTSKNSSSVLGNCGAIAVGNVANISDGGVSPLSTRGDGQAVRSNSTQKPLAIGERFGERSPKYISPYDDEYIGCRFDPKDPNTTVQFAWSMAEQERQREERRKKAAQTTHNSSPVFKGGGWSEAEDGGVISPLSTCGEGSGVRSAEDGGVISPLSTCGEGLGVSLDCQPSTANCPPEDLWLTYLKYDTNTARLPKDDRAAKEHWFRNKTIQNQQKLIQLYKNTGT